MDRKKIMWRMAHDDAFVFLSYTMGKMPKTPWPQLYTPTQTEYNPQKLNKDCWLL